MILYDAGVDQGGFGAAEGPSPTAASTARSSRFGHDVLQDAGRDQGGWSVADGPSHQLAVL